MRLSTKGRYGTMALLDLALHANNGPVPLKDIARRQTIPLHYLEHLIGPLVAAGIVGSTRGARGGLHLLKAPKDIKLSEVIYLLEGSMAPVVCVTNPESCPRAESCVTRDVWDEVKRAVDGVLEATTLQNLVDRQKKKDQATKGMYHI